MRRLLAALALLAAVGLGALAAPRTPEVRILITGEALGYLDSCGCAGFKEGGALRLTTAVHSLRQQGPCLYVDNGDLIRGADRQSQIKLETWAELLETMQLDALNLGEAEWSLGLDYLRYFQQVGGFSLLCANAWQLEEAAIKPFVVVDRAGLKVAFVGVLAGQALARARQSNPAVDFAEPEVALAQVRTAIAADVCVLLCHGTAEEASAVLEQNRWLQFAVAAHEGEVPASLHETAWGAMVVTPGQKSKALAKVSVLRSDDGPRTVAFTAQELGREIPEAADAKLILQGYRQRLRAEKLLDQLPREALPGEARYVGSAACRKCHASEHRLWQGTDHATALETLARGRSDADPECVVCHVVGLRYESGFTSPEQTPERANVGCESCHGPASLHVNGPQKAHRLPKSKGVCGRCHNAEHSPHFDKKAYWAKVKH